MITLKCCRRHPVDGGWGSNRIGSDRIGPEYGLRNADLSEKCPAGWSIMVEVAAAVANHNNWFVNILI